MYLYVAGRWCDSAVPTAEHRKPAYQAGRGRNPGPDAGLTFHRWSARRWLGGWARSPGIPCQCRPVTAVISWLISHPPHTGQRGCQGGRQGQHIGIFGFSNKIFETKQLGYQCSSRISLPGRRSGQQQAYRHGRGETTNIQPSDPLIPAPGCSKTA